MLLRLLISLALAVATAEASPPPPQCEEPPPSQHRLEVGAGLHTLIPDKLPDLSGQTFGYGPLVSLPIGSHALQAQGLYSNTLSTPIVLVDLALRLNLRLPLFTSYILAGAHVLHYEPPGNSHTFWGPNAGLGFTFHLTRSLDVHLGMRIYFQDRRLISFGAGIAYLI